MKKSFRKLIGAVTTCALLLTSQLVFPTPLTVNADSGLTPPQRLAGDSRYKTAIDISQAGWTGAEAVVLARGDKFPDALAGVVLAKSPVVEGPLLLTHSFKLTEGVLEEIQRLGASKVYILGGTGAVSEEVENALVAEGLQVERVDGDNRYETASAISLKGVEQNEKAFLAYAYDFPDALSISSYAAAQNIPLLLTDKESIPEATLEALTSLGVKEVTLIGGEAVIASEVVSQLEELGYQVDRLAGKDRYGTNLDILNSLPFNKESIYVATGQDFPDALAGAALAAKTNSPIFLVPPKKSIEEEGMNYLADCRNEGAFFTLLGGINAISYSLESIIRTGSPNNKISLQYWDGYANYQNYIKYLQMIPAPATDYVNFVSPNWRKEIRVDGTLDLVWGNTSNNYKQLTNMAHGLGLKVLPMINGSGATINTLLKSPAAQEKLIGDIVNLIEMSRADGIVIDFETPLDYDPVTGVRNDLTAFMEKLYGELNPKNKIVVMAVMPRMSDSQFWLDAYDYKALANYVDYMHVMTYDHHYRTSAPGPIAPYPWIKQVINYIEAQGVDLSKVLMGLPYYGRDWVSTGNGTYNSTAHGYAGMMRIAEENKATVSRHHYSGKDKDPVGSPTFTYTDDKGVKHTVFFDDPASWSAKLSVIHELGLAGVGCWAQSWVIEETAAELYPLLKQHLR